MQFSFSFAYFLLNTRLPKYMSSVLHLPILESGLFSALPYIVLCILNILSGIVGDFLINRSYLSRTNLRKLFGVICMYTLDVQKFYIMFSIIKNHLFIKALFCPAIFMVAASYAECNTIVAVICFVISVSTMCTFSSGVRVNCTDLSPNYASIIYACTSCIGLFAAFCAPILTSFLTPNVCFLSANYTCI